MVQKIIMSKVNFLVRFSSVDMVMMIVSSNTFKIYIVIISTLQIHLNLNPLYLVVLLLRQQLVLYQYQVGLDGQHAGVQ